MRVAILNCSDIARRRVIPAFQSIDGVEITAICSRDLDKAHEYAKEFEIPIYTDDPEFITTDVADLVYISSPPQCHHTAIRDNLLNGLHVLCEKSLTTDSKKTEDLIKLADSLGLIIQENYAFQYHPQWKWIMNNLNRIGKIQTVRSAFEFPPRDKSTDFRYKKALGGGALFDAGGYPIKAASLILKEIELGQFGSSSMIDIETEVDLTGSCYFVDSTGTSAYLSWSFDSTYKCFIEITGSNGFIRADKIFTPKSDEVVSIKLRTLDGDEEVTFQSDQFRDLIIDLMDKIKTGNNSHHKEIITQSKYQSYAKTTGIRAIIN